MIFWWFALNYIFNSIIHKNITDFETSELLKLKQNIKQESHTFVDLQRCCWRCIRHCTTSNTFVSDTKVYRTKTTEHPLLADFKILFFHGVTAPRGPGLPHGRRFTITFRRIALGTTSLISPTPRPLPDNTQHSHFTKSSWSSTP